METFCLTGLALCVFIVLYMVLCLILEILNLNIPHEWGWVQSIQYWITDKITNIGKK